MDHSKIRAILVDDETQSRVVLGSLLKSFSGNIQVVGEADSVEAAFTLITELQPQLVFLDIQMPGANGFSLLEKFEHVPFEVVFVTSYDKYAITAIKFSALDYLLKPVEVQDLKAAVERAQNKIRIKEQSGVQIINLLHNLYAEPKKLKVAVHTGDQVKFIPQDEIVFIEGDGSYSHVNTMNNQRYTTARYLKDFEEFFGSQSTFVRTHKNCLLNTLHIKGYSKGEPCIIEMVNGARFEVARRKKQEVLEKLKA